LQENDYYAFGYGIQSTQQTISPKNEYLYNHKELQEETGLYDYGARFYDPVIGRWTSVDPLAEKMRIYSPYNYGDDNPIRNIDPDGMAPNGCCDLPSLMKRTLNALYSAGKKKVENFVRNTVDQIKKDVKDKVGSISPYVKVDAKVTLGTRVAAPHGGVDIDMNGRSMTLLSGSFEKDNKGNHTSGYSAFDKKNDKAINSSGMAASAVANVDGVPIKFNGAVSFETTNNNKTGAEIGSATSISGGYNIGDTPIGVNLSYERTESRDDGNSTVVRLAPFSWGTSFGFILVPEISVSAGIKATTND
jgi:RHS repeat-associated protein